MKLLMLLMMMVVVMMMMKKKKKNLLMKPACFFLFNSTVARLSETRHLVFDAYVKIFQVEKTFAF